MLPLKSGRDYQELLVDADISLITQQSGSGNAFFPSKLLVTLAHSSPVLTVADEGSALARAVEGGGFGMNVEPGNVDRLANALRDLIAQGAKLQEWGRQGRHYVKQFEQQQVMEKFTAELAVIATAA
jgi:colanic acid biosynthesis glycosyl transferase WcaI